MGPPADDRGRVRSYFGRVRRGRWKSDPQRFDWPLAAAVLAVGEFSILSGHTNEGPRGLTAPRRLAFASPT